MRDDGGGIGRRELLGWLAALGGSAAATALGLAPRGWAAAQAPQFRSELARGVAEQRLPRGARIAVLGAGMAGLVAAYELEQAGYECTVLEARARPGGRVETLRAGAVVEELDSRQECRFEPDASLYFNTGPSRIAQHHAGLLSYCREFGVPLELFVNDNRGAYLYSRDAFGGAYRLRAVHAALRGNLAALLARALQRGALADSVPTEQLEALFGALLQYGDLDAALGWSGSPRAGSEPGPTPGAPALPAPFPELAEFLRLQPFTQFLFHGPELYDQQPSMLQPVGGMDRIPAAFERELRGHIRYRCEISAIRRSGEGARIEYRQRGQRESLAASHVIVALPGSVLRGIRHDFSAAVSQALAALQYTSAVKLAFQSPRFWESEDRIFGGISWTEDSITQLVYPSGALGTRDGILIGAYAFGGPAGDELSALAPRERIARALEQGSRLHPALRERVRRGVSRAWIKTPYSLGGWSLTPPAPALQEPDGPFYFAGDHSSELSGWMEGAVLSAQRALAQLLGLPLAGGLGLGKLRPPDALRDVAWQQLLR